MSVGIAEGKINPKYPLYVKIDYKDKYGNELYPDTLVMKGEKALTYPTQEVRNGRILRIIPIKDFEKV
jgi:hypothetical protein